MSPLGSTRRSRLLVAIGLFGIASCRQVFGLEEATVICPPELPGCKVCSAPSDCGPSTECHSWTCADSLCTPLNAAPASSCSTGVCSDDPLSECVPCVADGDCPGGGYCGTDRQCYRCDDGIKNGGEHDVDCGGRCKMCLGFPCTGPDDCQSGFCAPDGVCCLSECTDPCAWCPTDGNCSPLPKYVQDPDPVCSGTNVCDGGGGCRLRPGEVCVSDLDCASFRCANNRCAKLAGEPCDSALECVENACVNGTCAM